MPHFSLLPGSTLRDRHLLLSTYKAQRDRETHLRPHSMPAAQPWVHVVLLKDSERAWVWKNPVLGRVEQRGLGDPSPVPRAMGASASCICASSAVAALPWHCPRGVSACLGGSPLPGSMDAQPPSMASPHQSGIFLNLSVTRNHIDIYPPPPGYMPEAPLIVCFTLNSSCVMDGETEAWSMKHLALQLGVLN